MESIINAYDKLINYILFCLDELSSYEKTDFITGELNAYLDCLELILTPVKSSEELIALERRYGVI